MSYSIKSTVKKSNKGNMYLAITGYNNGSKVANICLFENGDRFMPHGRNTTKGQANLYSNWLSRVKDYSEPLILDCESIDNIQYTIGGLTIAVVDDGKLGDELVGDGLYLIINDIAYLLPSSDEYI